MTTATHARHIDKDDSGEYTVSCACRTLVRTRLESHALAVALYAEHKVAVDTGAWQAEQDAEAARLAALAPLHDAQRRANDAADEARSAGFAYIIAKQRGGDVAAALADLEAARAEQAAADAALAALEG